MTTKLVEWPSKRGPITKIMLPDGVKGDIAPLALELWYDFHEVGCHLGNVGSLPDNTSVPVMPINTRLESIV